MLFKFFMILHTPPPFYSLYRYTEAAKKNPVALPARKDLVFVVGRNQKFSGSVPGSEDLLVLLLPYIY
jgi:hypothetical protein